MSPAPVSALDDPQQIIADLRRDLAEVQRTLDEARRELSERTAQRDEALDRPALRLDDGRVDGALSTDGQILGTYVHGLFEDASGCAALLRWAGLNDPLRHDHALRREKMLDRLADAVERSLDIAKLLPWFEEGASRRR